MKNSIHLALFLILLSCSDTNENNSISKTKIVVKTNEVQANRVLEAEISGMVCKMGCGSSIRKEMLATKAVESCEIDYQDKRKTNKIKVTFDKNKISADKLVSKINLMNEKQFQVVKSDTKEFESQVKIESKINEEASEISYNESKIKILKENVQMPNLLSIFSKLITG
jgi:hypothetical protein